MACDKFIELFFGEHQIACNILGLAPLHYPVVIIRYFHFPDKHLPNVQIPFPVLPILVYFRRLSFSENRNSYIALCEVIYSIFWH